MSMERFRDYQVMISGISLAVGLVITSIVATSGLVAFKQAETRNVTVTGAANTFLMSDFVKWQPTLSRRADTVGQAYDALTKDMETARRYFLGKGLSPQEIKTSPPTTETIYVRDERGNNTNAVEGYTLRQSFDIQSGNVSRIERLASDAMELGNRGVFFETSPPQYFYSKLDDMKIKMLAMATENAKQRAQAMAQSTGNHIGPMRSSQMGVFQITPKYSTEVSDYGVNDTSTPDKKVTAVVNVTFTLE